MPSETKVANRHSRQTPADVLVRLTLRLLLQFVGLVDEIGTVGHHGPRDRSYPLCKARRAISFRLFQTMRSTYRRESAETYDGSVTMKWIASGGTGSIAEITHEADNEIAGDVRHRAQGHR
jgi:hypothetical protein